MSDSVADRWRQLPDYAKAAGLGLGVGGLVALSTQNVAAGVGVAVVLGGLGFMWSAAPNGHTVFLALAAGGLCLAWMFATAHLMTVAPQVDPTQDGGFAEGHFDCGTVLGHLVSDPVVAWDAEQQTMTATGADRPGSASLVGDCRSQMDGGRLRFVVCLIFGVVAGLLLAWPASNPSSGSS